MGMMLVHESGHVLGVWMSGGTVVRVVWFSGEFSRTDAGVNPWPMVEVWGGPVVGVAVPLMGYWLVRWLRWSRGYLVCFFAGFCWVVNGVYIGMGVAEAVGDSRKMLRLGTPMWVLGCLGVWEWWVAFGCSMWRVRGWGLGRGEGGEEYGFGLVVGLAAGVTGVAMMIGARG